MSRRKLSQHPAAVASRKRRARLRQAPAAPAVTSAPVTPMETEAATTTTAAAVIAEPVIEAAAPVIQPLPARQDDGHDADSHWIVPAALLPLAVAGAAGGCMRLCHALESAGWGETALYASVIALAVEAGCMHYGRQAWQARSWVVVLVCVLGVLGAAGIDVAVGQLAPQLAARQQAGTILDNAADRLAHPAEVPTQDAAAGTGKQGLLQHEKNTGDAIALQKGRDGELASLTQQQLDNVKPVAGESWLTIAATLGGSVCGVLVPLLLGELTRRRLVPVPSQEAAREPQAPCGGQLAPALAAGPVEALAPREPLLLRLARWPLLRALLLVKRAAA